MHVSAAEPPAQPPERYVQRIRAVTDATADPDGSAAEQLRSATGRGQIDAGVDVDGALRAYDPAGVTVVLVGPDGVVLDGVRDARAQAPLPGLRVLQPE